MKTKVVMLREYNIRQETKTRMFNATDLMVHSDKLLANFMVMHSTKSFIAALEEEYGLDKKEVVRTSTGRNGGTWMHPLLFIDLAMWISPQFKVKALAWLYDNLIEFREHSGDAFREANAALTAAFPAYFDRPYKYAKLANTVAAACKVGLGPERWNQATKEQLKLREAIYNNVAILADVMPSAPECMAAAIRKTGAFQSTKEQLNNE